ncbi:hypothetical protein [Salinigranum salinum]|uniref:hypothetical protein n=1 Tax=Salinigranum salinum TaxID=1364937 RepID=UPI00126081B6|nr:hypothetical protein [Salinigranum salinum]
MDTSLYDGWSPYTFTVPHHLSVLFVVGLAILPVFWLPREYRRPSQVILWWLYPVAYIPVVTLHAFLLEEPRLVFALTVAISFFILRLSYYLPQVRVRETVPHPIFYRLLVLVTVALMSLLLGVFSQSITIANLSEIYEVRSSFRETLQSFGAVFFRVIAYGITWLENVLVPILIASPLAGLMPTWVFGVGVAATLVVYAVGAFKSAIFAVGMAIILYVTLQDDGKYLPAYAMLAGPTTLGTFLVLDRLGAPSQVLGLVRRMFVSPGMVTAFHVDFFSTNPHTLWAGRTWIGLPYPYSKPVANLIGSVYFGIPDMVANGPFWASGYAGAGILGIVLVAIIFAVALYALDCASAGLPKRFVGAVVAGQLTGIAYSSTLNVLLLGGFGLLVVLLLFMPVPNRGVG